MLRVAPECKWYRPHYTDVITPWASAKTTGSRYDLILFRLHTLTCIPYTDILRQAMTQGKLTANARSANRASFGNYVHHPA